MLTRAKLLSRLSLFRQRGADVSTIDDVIEAAGVARGASTHFQTLEGLSRRRGTTLPAGINRWVMPAGGNEPDSAVRVALSFRIFIHFTVQRRESGMDSCCAPAAHPDLARKRRRCASMSTESSPRDEAARFAPLLPIVLADFFGMLIETIRRD